MKAPVPSRPSEVREWCISNDFHPNKTLGQNFLIDKNAVDAILDCAGVAAGAKVLEVGPGLGALTHAIVGRGASVVAVEKDTRLAALLSDALAGDGRARIVAGDMLDVPLDGLLSEGFDMCVSNLPYSVGTRILLELCRHPLAPKLLVVMVQREVAERMAAGPGDEARGMVGVWIQADYDVTLARTVRPSCFWPRPEVSSTVVRLVRREPAGGAAPFSSARARRLFERVSKTAFMHRRKQMGTVFRKVAGDFGLDGDGVARWLARAGVDATARPETLSGGDWIRLAEELAATPEAEQR